MQKIWLLFSRNLVLHSSPPLTNTIIPENRPNLLPRAAFAMVRILQLRRTVVMACLLAHTAVCLTPVPLTVEDVKTIYSDLTGQTREASTAAKTIDPGYSFILYGLTRSGPVKVSPTPEPPPPAASPQLVQSPVYLSTQPLSK